MPVVYTVPTIAPPPPAPVDPTDLAGEDVLFRSGKTVAPAGDWATVRDVPAALQSVEREAPVSPGALVRRLDWGWGIRAELGRVTSRAERDRVFTKAQRALAANPRVTRVRQLSVDAMPDGRPGIVVDVRFDAGGKDARAVLELKPDRSGT